MAFSLGFNCRATAPYVTDQSFAVPCLGESYPHTYTNGDGYSLNAGITSAWNVFLNRSAGLDPRCAGDGFASNNGTPVSFRADLDSGSAPGAGDYDIDMALGDIGSPRLQDFQLKDNTTVLIDGRNGGSGIATADNEWIDATLTGGHGGATWLGTPVSKTFATTVMIYTAAMDNIGNNTSLAHLRLTFTGGGTPPVTSTRRLSVRGA